MLDQIYLFPEYRNKGIASTLMEFMINEGKKKNIINLIKYHSEGNDIGFRNEAYEIAKEFDVSRRKLIKYNDLYKGYNIKAGDIIYLEKKNNKATKEYRFHTTANGESLYSISQKYGIKLKKLYKMNPEYENYTRLKVGDVINLR